MYKDFLKPIKMIFFVFILGGLSIASDIAQLTSFNFLEFLNQHAPQSFYFLIVGTVLLYFVLVIIELIRNKPIQQTQGSNIDQIISTGNVKNSTIIQIKKDKED